MSLCIYLNLHFFPQIILTLVYNRFFVSHATASETLSLLVHQEFLNDRVKKQIWNIKTSDFFFLSSPMKFFPNIFFLFTF